MGHPASGQHSGQPLRVGGSQGFGVPLGRRPFGCSYCGPGLKVSPCSSPGGDGLTKPAGRQCSGDGGGRRFWNVLGRDDSDCCRPLCTTPSLYTYRALSCTPPGCLLLSLTCKGSAGVYTTAATVLSAASALKDLP